MDIPFDINNTLDLIKLKFYNEWLYTAHIYDEGDSPFHKDLTSQIVTQYIDPLELDKEAHILDLGCGPGYFLDEMKEQNGGEVVFVATTIGDYEVMSANMQELKRYIKQIGEVVVYYRNVTIKTPKGNEKGVAVKIEKADD